MISPQLQSAVESLAAALRPAERLPLSTWCDRHARLSPEASSRFGTWSTFAFQREPLDVMCSTHPRSSVVMFASQMGKTQLILNFIANVIAEDPGPILFIEPTLQMAEAISKDRLSTMFRDTPILRGLVADPKARDSGSTILHRQFQRGHLTLIGANSPAGMASRPIRYVLEDEPDRYPPSAGAEGDQLVLAAARQESFWNAKTVIAGTPTVKGASRIETAFRESDQRHFRLPCPHCGHFQRLTWPRLEWPDGRTDEARYRCEKCDKLIDHHEKHGMMARGVWVASNPGSTIAGFHCSRMISPWNSWAVLAERWGRAQGNIESLRAFLNTRLAECFDEAGRADVTEADLLARRENYGPMIPERAAVITEGVDVQADRLEVSIYAWGAGEESWLMVHRVIPGDPTGAQLWRDLDAFLSAHWQHPTIGPMPIHAVCLDSGHLAGQVCRFADDRRGRRVWAIKAAAGQRPVWPKKQSRQNRSLEPSRGGAGGDLCGSAKRMDGEPMTAGFLEQLASATGRDDIEIWYEEDLARKVGSSGGVKEFRQDSALPFSCRFPMSYWARYRRSLSRVPFSWSSRRCGLARGRKSPASSAIFARASSTASAPATPCRPGRWKSLPTECRSRPRPSGPQKKFRSCRSGQTPRRRPDLRSNLWSILTRSKSAASQRPSAFKPASPKTSSTATRPWKTPARRSFAKRLAPFRRSTTGKTFAAMTRPRFMCAWRTVSGLRSTPRTRRKPGASSLTCASSRWLATACRCATCRRSARRRK